MVATHHMPPDVTQEWNSVHDEVLHLHGQWKVYIGIYGKEKNFDLMQLTTPDVFAVIQEALRHEITMIHGRLLDPARSAGHDTMSLARLVQTLKPHYPPDFHADLVKKLEQIKTHCSPMLLWRHNRVGHKNRDIALGLNNATLPHIERKEIETGLKLLAEFINGIDLHFNDRTTPFDHVLMRGTPDDFMGYFQKVIEANDRELAAKLGITVEELKKRDRNR